MNMMRHYFFCFSFFLTSLSVFTHPASGQNLPMEEIDLRPLWKSFKQGEFVDYEPEGAVYFSIREADGILKVSGSKPMSIYVNHQLIVQKQGTIRLKLDSLQYLYGTPTLFTVRSSEIVSTKLIRPIPPEQLVKRKATYFKDFIIVVALGLLVMLTSLLYVNPKLTLDYFNVVKFLSLQEREESLTAIRTTSRINFVYYLFCSLWISFLFMVLGQTEVFRNQYFWATAQSFSFHLVDWLLLSVIIFFVIMSKLIGLSLLARLFNIREVASFQFFNSVRLFFITSAMSSVLAVLFFIFNVTNPSYYFLILKIGFGLMGFGVILLLLKLLPKVPFRFSHLFSYLCASEIIPLMILIKVFFK